MPAVPAVGQSFRQESFKGYAEDYFTILSMDATASVPYGSFSGALLTEERTPLEPDVVAQKVYVKGIGQVFENDTQGPTEYSKLVGYTK